MSASPIPTIPSSVWMRTRNASWVPSARPVSTSPRRKTIGSTSVILTARDTTLARDAVLATRRRLRRRTHQRALLGDGARRELARGRTSPGLGAGRAGTDPGRGRAGDRRGRVRREDRPRPASPRDADRRLSDPAAARPGESGGPARRGRLPALGRDDPGHHGHRPRARPEGAWSSGSRRSRLLWETRWLRWPRSTVRR